MLSLQLRSARIRTRSNWSNFSNNRARVQEGEVPFALKSHDNVVQWMSFVNNMRIKCQIIGLYDPYFQMMISFSFDLLPNLNLTL